MNSKPKGPASSVRGEGAKEFRVGVKVKAIFVRSALCFRILFIFVFVSEKTQIKKRFVFSKIFSFLFLFLRPKRKERQIWCSFSLFFFLFLKNRIVK